MFLVSVNPPLPALWKNMPEIFISTIRKIGKRTGKVLTKGLDESSSISSMKVPIIKLTDIEIPIGMVS